VPKAAATLAQAYPGIELSLIDRHPVEALQMLRHGEIDVALIFRYADAPVEDEGFRLLHIGDDPIYLISQRPDDSLANHRHSAWIGGCDRCQAELLAVDDIDRDRHRRHQHVLDRIAVNQISPNNPTRQEVISELRDRPIHSLRSGLDRSGAVPTRVAAGWRRWCG
jgi:DNA-binding transcriptional LysR family regulator